MESRSATSTIWFGGTDRSEASIDDFFKWLGPKKSPGSRMAVMDMWKPFRTSTRRHAPKASILFDKLPVLRQLGEALDTVRKSGCGRFSGKDRRFIFHWFGPALPAVRRMLLPARSPRGLPHDKERGTEVPA